MKKREDLKAITVKTESCRRKCHSEQKSALRGKEDKKRSPFPKKRGTNRTGQGTDGGSYCYIPFQRFISQKSRIE
jgi:hypothetical protein